jgi:polyferredoxin
VIELPRAPAAPRSRARSETPRGFDLLSLPGLRTLIRWRYARLLFQVPLLLLALFVIVDGLTGRQLAPRNIATTSVWLHYRGFVVLALALFGNAFCAACPLMLTRGPSRALKRLLGGDRPWPRFLRSKALVIVLLLAFIYAYEAFALWSSPWLTAWLVIGYFLAALSVDTFFPAGSFCRYVCPLGHFNYVLAHTSPTVIATVDPDVCTGCESKACLHGRVSLEGPTPTAPLPVEGTRRAGYVPLAEVVAPNGRGSFPGCETGLFVPTIRSTMDCTMCGNCIRSCPYDNVALRVRNPLREATSDGWGRRTWTTVTVMGVLLLWWGLLNAVAMIPPYFAAANVVADLFGTRNEALVLAILVVVWTLLGVAATLGAALLADLAGGAREGVVRALRRWGPVFVVLAVGTWSAHYLFHFLTGALQIIPVFQHFFDSRGMPMAPNWRLGQLVPSRFLFPIGAGIASLYGLAAIVAGGFIAFRDFGRRGVLAMWPIGLFALALTVLAVLVMAQPMEMRGTLLGPAW